ncbi:AGE family epimerase/isomerase [Marinagarivorans algicola]|uniref:AGE family epimerase/isomerase n=1 Tax=Marinagarivorans algicola TaxID=1513270 RepID=UPI003735C4F0
MNNLMSEQLLSDIQRFKKELLLEFSAINNYWLSTVLNDQGFLGEISAVGEAKADADKGIILTTRMLWYFSEAALYAPEPSLVAAAHKMYDFIAQHFIDQEHGGVFWSLDANGDVVNGRKQTYAQAFAVYALSAYYRLSRNMVALTSARSIYGFIEKHAYDSVHGGYFEAFDRDWGALDDIRLSEKDLPSAKTMNTHLHMLEAFTGLLQAERVAANVAAATNVENSLKRLLETYENNFIDYSNGHLKMFLSRDWTDESIELSYGHDIESSWLVWEALEVLAVPALTKRYQSQVETLFSTCFKEGIAKDGSALEVFDLESGKAIHERIWWVQAEAMVGYFNAWQMTADDKYWQAVLAVWHFIKEQVIDSAHGEWHWVAQCDQQAQQSFYKVGFWKGPYHNGRSLIELCRRIESLNK